MTSGGEASGVVRIAAAGDVHADDSVRDRLLREFASLDADLLLLAGDLTTTGEPEQARIVAEACAGIDVPVIAVLGNHDWHAGKQDAIADTLAGAGVRVLAGTSTCVRAAGLEIGVVGTKGFVGGFRDFTLPDFGEPLLREVYAETGAEVDAIETGLREIADCEVRIVLLHYAPTPSTLAGEPEAILPFLGSDRMAAPITAHLPDLVVHGHGHAGRFEGAIGVVPVFNVAVHVTRRAFAHFSLTPGQPPALAPA
jgi:uncharacterized protein